MVFYDFEVTKYNWMVVCIDPAKDEPYKIVDNKDQLNEVYEQYKEDIWVGFNSRHYDQYILKTILCGLSAWDCNKWIIRDKKPGWAFSNLFKNIFLINYDVMPLNSSLKQLEGFQGHSIYESDIPFDIDRPLKGDEIEEMLHYCQNDVEETMNVFLENINDFNALLWLVKEFKFPLSYMSRTKAQISAEILQCERTERDDEWDLSVLPCIWLNNKPRQITVKNTNNSKTETVFMMPDDWFLEAKYQNYDYYFEMDVCGVTHTLAWGGIHGGRKQYHYKCDKDHLLIHVDVASYYPRLMIHHNLLTRSAKKPERFKEIYDKRIELKHAGKKKEQAPLKIVINGTYGICKDPQNKAYDARNANLVCINGQLMLLDLIEHLSVIESFELIQSNTDGLIIKVHRRDFDQVDDICYEWEHRCNMELEFDYIEEIWEKDVNNYIFRQFDGKIERKGAYVKELSSMDNDLPILNKAVNDYMLKGVPVEKTINNCNELIMFQKICKLTANYDYVTHNDHKYYNKCYRIFASRDMTDGPVKKIKAGGRADKFANTSLNSFIDNSDITDKTVPPKLDKEWYIEEAQRRLEQYGC